MTKIILLFQFYDIAPPCGGVWGFEVVLDGIGEDVGFAFAILLGVLLAADDDGLGAVAFVDAVYHLVELPELLDVFGIEVEEILLQRAVGCDAEDDDASPLVEVALSTIWAEKRKIRRKTWKFQK